MSKQRLALDRAYRAIKSMLDNGEWYEPWNVLAQIEEALAEPEPEPVAEVRTKTTGGNAGIATVIHEIYTPNREPLKPGDNLYLAPTALTEPLTDEDISAIVQSMSAYTWDAHMLARAIERAHGIEG